MRGVGYNPILIWGRVGPNSEMNLQLTTGNCWLCNVLPIALNDSVYFPVIRLSPSSSVTDARAAMCVFHQVECWSRLSILFICRSSVVRARHLNLRPLDWEGLDDSDLRILLVKVGPLTFKTRLDVGWGFCLIPTISVRNGAHDMQLSWSTCQRRCLWLD